jgi:hypothetical protein
MKTKASLLIDHYCKHYDAYLVPENKIFEDKVISAHIYVARNYIFH